MIISKNMILKLIRESLNKVLHESKYQPDLSDISSLINILGIEKEKELAAWLKNNLKKDKIVKKLKKYFKDNHSNFQKINSEEKIKRNRKVIKAALQDFAGIKTQPLIGESHRKNKHILSESLILLWSLLTGCQPETGSDSCAGKLFVPDKETSDYAIIMNDICKEIDIIKDDVLGYVNNNLMHHVKRYLDYQNIDKSPKEREAILEEYIQDLHDFIEDLRVEIHTKEGALGGISGRYQHHLDMFDIAKGLGQNETIKILCSSSAEMGGLDPDSKTAAKQIANLITPHEYFHAVDHGIYTLLGSWLSDMSIGILRDQEYIKTNFIDNESSFKLRITDVGLDDFYNNTVGFPDFDFFDTYYEGYFEKVLGPNNNLYTHIISSGIQDMDHRELFAYITDLCKSFSAAHNNMSISQAMKTMSSDIINKRWDRLSTEFGKKYLRTIIYFLCIDHEKLIASINEMGDDINFINLLPMNIKGYEEFEGFMIKERKKEGRDYDYRKKDKPLIG
jgi:hypothetical protein